MPAANCPLFRVLEINRITVNVFIFPVAFRPLAVRARARPTLTLASPLDAGNRVHFPSLAAIIARNERRPGILLHSRGE